MESYEFTFAARPRGRIDWSERVTVTVLAPKTDRLLTVLQRAGDVAQQLHKDLEIKGLPTIRAAHYGSTEQ